MNKPKDGFRIERGPAAIRIELSDGNITVRHGEDNTVLAELKNAPVGTWSKLWLRLIALGLKRIEPA